MNATGGRPAAASKNPPAEASPLCGRSAIGEHGWIADGATGALIDRAGTLAWLCIPRFDSPAIFASLLDPHRGGCCFVGPAAGGAGRQRYLAHTNILATDFTQGQSGIRVTDWMPARGMHSLFRTGAVCRLVEGLRGRMRVRLACAPRLDYGRERVRWERLDGGPSGRWWLARGRQELHLTASCDLTPQRDGLAAEFELRAGQSCWLVLNWDEAAPAFREEGLRHSLSQTRRAWEDWARQGQYGGKYKDIVERSALALKALIYEPTGAFVAAPTTSLPEAPGGARNWDYRYCWPRDSTFALYGLSLLGYHEEAGRFLHFLAHVASRHPLPLQVCYRVDGSADLPERELGYLEGYADSRPVRVGNGAAAQFQLDLYGEILDAAYTYAKWRGGLERNVWEVLSQLAQFAARHWREADNGIWEVRGGRRHFVYSKVMCWVALDRALKLADRYGLPAPHAARWRQGAAEIRQAVFRHGYSRRAHAFAQSFGSDVVDASALLLPLVRFVKPHDPHIVATIRAVRRELTRGPFLLRYANTGEDGVGGAEGAFSICSFWLTDCLTLLGQAKEARSLFERIIAYRSPLGLFSEEIDWTSPRSRQRLLGNFPQAFTHLALINAAHNLELYPRGVKSSASRRPRVVSTAS
ncbi:MAG: glycoside hydrolase family 15 protein [Terriglobales bacterium]